VNRRVVILDKAPGICYNAHVLQDVNHNNLDNGNYAQADSRLAGPGSTSLGVSNSGENDAAV